MNRYRPILFVLLIVAGFFAAGSLNRELTDRRRTYGITQADPLINAPPLVVFTTVAFGGFRGIVADLLWIRSARLQQEGKYFELVQLADWITKLEPRFTGVWAYHAWNLTYNISVLFNDAENRWRWVRHGIGLLRDEGLRYNPDEPGLLYELGWMFYHKLGSNTDDMHLFYKRAWAAEMEQALGTGAIEKDYKLDPAVMAEIDSKYGPLDWRLPHAHAVYWASKSKELSRPFERLLAQRMVYQSLVESFRGGRLFTGANNELFVLSPSLELWPGVIRAYEEAMAHPEDRGSTVFALSFFLREAVLYLQMYGRMDEANACLARLKEIDPTVPADISAYQLAMVFAADAEIAENRQAVFAMIESSLYRAIIARSAGDESAAHELEDQASTMWEQFMTPRSHNQNLIDRLGLPPLDQIRQSAQARF
jgi:hypothetical protein